MKAPNSHHRKVARLMPALGIFRVCVFEERNLTLPYQYCGVATQWIRTQVGSCKVVYSRLGS